MGKVRKSRITQEQRCRWNHERYLCFGRQGGYEDHCRKTDCPLHPYRLIVKEGTRYELVEPASPTRPPRRNVGFDEADGGEAS